MKKIIIITSLIIAWLLPLPAIAQSANQNYILTRTYTSASAFYDDINYYDGLGRPVETVRKQFTPASKDLVSRIQYDRFGRDSLQWLPAPNTKSDGTYNGSSASYYGDSYPYSETAYEPSPLNRVQYQYGPGAIWRSGNHRVTTEYLTNKAADANLNCPSYSWNANDGNSFSKTGEYGTGQLFVTKTTDEDGNISYEFKDKLGRVLLQRRVLGATQYDTNYIYDDLGNLKFILPPNASDATKANQAYGFWNTYNNFGLFNNVYNYYYDERNRKAGQVIPGKDVENFIYDSADRLVMDQSPAIELPVGGRGWLFNKYDALGRVILSGIYHGDDKSTRNANERAYDMQIKFKSILSKESVVNSIYDYFYTWNTFPALKDVEITRVNFYDDYTYAAAGSPIAPFVGNPAFQTKTGYGTQYASAKGLLTGTWEKLTDGSWSRTVYYYDAMGNIVQKRTALPANGSYNYEYYAYNYNNRMTKKYIEHSAFGQAMTTEEYTYNYNDPRLRLTSVNYKLNGEATGVDIATYKYNDLGQIQEKKTGGGKETAAFKYNLRGWETEQAGQRFSENLYYESGHPKTGSTVYYGGNASAMTWRAESNTATLRGYSFKYNTLGWLTDAVYGEGTGLTTGLLKYDELFTYDKNGNVKTVKRYGMKDNNTYGLIDDLSPTYIGNQTRTMSDAVTANQNSSDVMELKFNSTPINDGHYFYDGAGAFTVDYHKRICMMKYNYLSLPQSVQFQRGDRIEYVYDAAGVKRKVTRKITKTDMNYGYWSLSEPASSDFDAAKTVTTEYIGNKVYVNNQLKYILTEEGYIEKNGTVYTAYYYLNDHLGSPRIVMDAAGTVKQVNNYYPSGTLMAERRTDQGVQPWKFEGKELDRFNNLDFYDFEARAYDPVLMRFTRPDPLAEKYPGLSPYCAFANNPVNVIDPDGRDFRLLFQRDKDGNITGMTIQSTVYITGENASAERAADLKKMAKDVYKSKTIGGIKVSFDVNYKYNKDITVADLGKGDNLLDFNNKVTKANDRSHVNGSRIGDVYQTGNTGEIYSDAKNGTVLHETGHFLGLADRYDIISASNLGDDIYVSHDGYKNDLMRGGNNKSLDISHYGYYILQFRGIHQKNAITVRYEIERNKRGFLMTPYEKGGIHHVYGGYETK